MVAGVTLEKANEILAALLEAEIKVATDGQALTIDGDGTSRTYTRADLGKLGERIKYWRDQVAVLSSPSGATGVRRRVRYVVPR